MQVFIEGIFATIFWLAIGFIWPITWYVTVPILVLAWALTGLCLIVMLSYWLLQQLGLASPSQSPSQSQGLRL